MSVQVKFKSGYVGSASEKVAEILEKRGEVELVGVDEKQPKLIKDEPKQKSGTKA